MPYIKKESEKKGDGKVNMMLSTARDRSAIEGQPDPMEDGNVVHFIFSKLLKTKGLFQILRTVVISIDLHGQELLGIYQPREHRAQMDYDVSDFLHGAVYVRGVLGAKTQAEISELWGVEQNTTFIANLPHEGWLIAQRLLIDLRNEKIAARMLRPRQSMNQKFSGDFVDTAIAKICLRVNSVMNQLLRLGDISQLDRFSSDTTIC